jgi:hypothetical protein
VVDRSRARTLPLPCGASPVLRKLGFTGGFRAAGMTVLGVVLGGKMADKAKEATAMHVDARRRKKPSPLKNVVVNEGPHP